MNEKTSCMEEKIEVYDTPLGEVLCGRCGYELECDEFCDMPEICPECGGQLSYGGNENGKYNYS